MSLNNEIDASKETELMMFAKYSKLVPVLREHILSYAQRTELKNYAECSSYCNSEVQRFNTVAPKLVTINDQYGDISVSLAYKSTERGSSYFRLQNKMFKKTWNMMNEIRGYILKCYKYVKEGRTEQLDINMMTWPSELMNSNVFAEFDDLKVTIYGSMYKNFMIYANKNKLKNIRLWGNFGHKMTAEFFKSRLFKNADVFTTNLMVSEIDDIDFIDAQHSYISLNSSISDEAIRQKIEKINADAKTIDQRIENFVSDSHIYDMAVLFPRDRFPNQVILEENKKHRIGKVEVSINHHGRWLQLLVRQ